MLAPLKWVGKKYKKLNIKILLLILKSIKMLILNYESSQGKFGKFVQCW
jgi:hypothetical protein